MAPLLVIAAACGLCAAALASVASRAAPRPIAFGEGATKDYRWVATVVRDGGRQGGKRPCVGITTIESGSKNSAHGPFEGHSSVCSALAPSAAPNIVSVSLSDPEATIFAIGAASGVVRLQADVGELGHRTVSLKPLNSQQARNAQVRSSNYGVLVIKGHPCIEQITGVNSNGKIVYDGPDEPCGDN
jgi:hypothetical protein